METYIITFEDGQHFQTKELIGSDISAADDGLISIIRISDMKEYVGEGQWSELSEWGK